MLLRLTVLLLFGSIAKAAIYSVGESQTFASIGEVPLNSLRAGDEVRIHAKPEPYKEKFVINSVGTAEAPIVFRGVPDTNGNLPVIDGDGAITPRSQDYWNEVRSLIKVGGSSVPATTDGPRHIRIENLNLRNAHAKFSFIDDGGDLSDYVDIAACIHIEQGSFIDIVGNEISACGNGIFVTPGVSNVLIESNYIHGNGNIGSNFEHNTYTEAIGIVYRFNHFGPLCPGCEGNNLKDRSGGLEVAYNFIEGGNRQLDLVDSGDSTIRADGRYSTTLVYGNILVESENIGNRQMVHYGGDSGTISNYRKGILHFYHNTVVSKRQGRNTFMRLSSNAETCDARNNIIFVTAPGKDLELLAEDRGTLMLSSTWITSGYVLSFANPQSGKVTLTDTVTGTDPGFVNITKSDYHLLGSLLPSTSLASGLPSVDTEYVMHTSSQLRSSTDLGAFGFEKACKNDRTWHWVNKRGRKLRCSWAAKKPIRCFRRGSDGRRAMDGCPVSCNSCSCQNNPDWYWLNKSGQKLGCKWVARKPKRCSRTGLDGAGASMTALDGCTATCNSCTN